MSSVKRNASPLPNTPSSRIVTLKYDTEKLVPLFQAANLATTTTANTPAGPSTSDAPVESPARAGTATPSSNTMPSTTTTTTTGRAMPAEAVENGAPLRVYLNTKVTQHVTDGMKKLALEK